MSGSLAHRTPSPGRGPHQLLGRAALLATAIVCLLGQGAALAHLALVRHAACPEHEDGVVHAPAGADATAARGRPDGPAAGRAGPAAAAPAGAEDHDDDHCLVAGFRRNQLTTPASHAAELPTPDAPPDQTAIAVPAVRAGPVPLLLLAPKSSPPIG